jgi:hypothetical protein
MLLKCWLIMHNTILGNLMTLQLLLGVVKKCKVPLIATQSKIETMLWTYIQYYFWNEPL